MKSFISRVKFALQGWLFFFSHETNGRIQAVIAALVVVAGFVFQITTHEWLWILLCIAMVIGLEMVNTAFETLSNRLHPDLHPDIKIVKDVAAGAVLWVAVFSVLVGALIFGPKVWGLIS